MKRNIIFCLIFIIVPILLNAKIVGYRDRDKNHVNDLFRDANGDGINDVTGRRYKHRFPFIDKNKDHINDAFIDTNGDGFNDTKNEFYRKLYICIDFNRDGINDITGKRYKNALRKKSISIRHTGKIKKTGGIAKKTVKKVEKRKYDTFIDKNHNGIDDRREYRKAVILKKKKNAGKREKM